MSNEFTFVVCHGSGHFLASRGPLGTPLARCFGLTMCSVFIFVVHVLQTRPPTFCVYFLPLLVFLPFSALTCSSDYHVTNFPETGLLGTSSLSLCVLLTSDISCKSYFLVLPVFYGHILGFLFLSINR